MVVPTDTQDFQVVWEVNYYDQTPEQIYYVHERITSKDLDSLMDHLGENSVDHEPENETPTGLGDFNIEWIMIKDYNGKELWKDKEYDFTNYYKEQASDNF